MDTGNQMSVVTSDEIEMEGDDYSDEENVDCNDSMNVNNGDDSSSSSTSSDEDGQLSDDEEDEPVDVTETEKTISELEQQLQTNPYYYDGHVQLIACLKKLKDLKRLKNARTGMSSLFPLTEELWMDWIKDEEDGDQKQILLEKAIEDYDSIQMWLELAFHLMKDNDSSHVRDMFERALARLGRHSNEGSLIWDAYREYELALLAGMQPLPGSMLTNEQQGLMAEQTQRVAKLFSRQLSCPLIDLEKTYQEYKDWTDEVDPQVTKKFESSQEKLKTFLPFEEKLLVETSLENYNSYLEHAILNFDPSHINCLFERAIKDHPIQSELWVKYAQYLEKNLKIKDVILGTYKRSVRNCPWCLELWMGYLRALEKYEAGHERIRSVFNDSLLVGFSEAHQYLSLWTAYIDYLRRRVDWTREGQSQELEDLRDAFDNANNQLLQTFSSAGDPTCSLLQYQALVEAKYCKNMSKAREIFSMIMQQGLANQATPWLQYAQLERSFGDIKHCRKVFQRALNSATDWPEYITEAYIRFEREEGDLDHYLEALEKCQSQMVRIEERRAKEGEKEPKNQRSKGKQQNKPTPTKNVNKDFHNKFVTKKGARRGDGDSVVTVKSSTEVQNVEVKPYIKSRTKVFTRSDVKESQPIVDSDGFKVPHPPASVTPSLSMPPPGYKRKLDDANDDRSSKRFKESPEAGPVKPPIGPEPSSSGPVGHKPHNDLATVFVSNLEYSVTREEIEKIFEEVGALKEVRLVSNFKGQSRGYAYVEFMDEVRIGHEHVADTACRSR